MAPYHYALGFLLLMFLVTPLFAEEFYYLSLLWPGAYCAQSKCCLPTTGEPKVDFFVSSFEKWDTISGKAETKCKSTNFSIAELEDLKADLHDYWSSIRCPSNDGKTYWRNAWKKYGGCSGLSEKDYFKTALELRSQVDVLKHLKDEGYGPSLERIRGVKDIKETIKKYIGAEPLLRCSKEKKFGTYYFQLYQVYICVAQDGKTIIDCPVKQNFTCYDKDTTEEDAEILFIPFDTNELQKTEIDTDAASSSVFTE